MTAYVPPWLPQPDTAYAVEFAQRIGFATVIALDAIDPAVSHIPVHVDPGDQTRPLRLRFHVAAGNLIVQRVSHKAQILAIFRSTDGYISPTWYDHENVPTWNYAAVHMKGNAEPLTTSELRSHLHQLVEHHDSGLEIRSEFIEQYLPGIRGFSITSPHIEPVFKLSQDKNPASFNGTLSGLHAHSGKELGAEMSSLKKHLNTTS